jgi:hypothetical protein
MDPGRMAIGEANHALPRCWQTRQNLIDSSKINCLSEQGKILKITARRANHQSTLLILRPSRLPVAP